MNSMTEFKSENLIEVHGKKLLLNVDLQGQKSVDWAKENHSEVERLIKANGAILIRGLNISGSKQLSSVMSILFGKKLLSYVYRSTPRKHLRANVYTATEYHSDEVIPQHNESSYSNKWPMRIGFFCQKPSKSGGETPIADSRLIYKELPKELIEKFEQKKVRYVRNYQDIDLPWSEVFQTQDKQSVEAFCLENAIEFEWLPDNGLRTWQVNQAIARHPETGDLSWFNQAHLFHISNLGRETRDSLISVIGKDMLPRNAYFGDGSDIPDADLEIIRAAYEKHQIAFSWEENDLMLLDNMMFSHGRKSYSGERKVLTAMA